MQKDSIGAALAGVVGGAMLTIALLITVDFPSQALIWANANPTPIATVLSALVGFAGVALATRAGFRNLIASQESQSKRDRDARAEQLLSAEKDREEQRQYQKKTVAAALHGELIALLGRVHEYESIYRAQYIILHAIVKNNRNLSNEFDFMPANFKLPVFQSNIPHLGVLGVSIIADVVEVLSKAQSTQPSNSVKLQASILSEMYKNLSKTYLEWGSEIVHVGARLLSVQGYGEDPGTLYDYRQSKKSLKSTGDQGVM